MRNRHFLLLDLVLLGMLPFASVALRVESTIWPLELTETVLGYAAVNDSSAASRDARSRRS